MGKGGVSSRGLGDSAADVYLARSGPPFQSISLITLSSGMTCWRRLAEWQEAGGWQRLHETLLAELRAADKLD